MRQNDQALFSQIFEINGILEKLPRDFNKAKNSLSNGDYYKYAKQIVDATLLLEKATLKARSVANFSFKKKNMPLEYSKMMDKIASEAHNISIETNEKTTKITLPNTLPHYKNNFKSMLVEPLNFKLKIYKKEHGFPEYTSVVFVIVNNISSNKNTNTIRDNDNYDYKQIVNNVSYWLLNDDGYKYCSMFNCTKISEQDSTEIYVVPKSLFPEWCSQNSQLF